MIHFLRASCFNNAVNELKYSQRQAIKKEATKIRSFQKFVVQVIFEQKVQNNPEHRKSRCVLYQKIPYSARHN